VPFSPTKDSDFWKITAPDLFMQALDRLPDERFDAVVVDEGQDFHPDWWIPMEIINRGGDKGPFFVFFDPAQNLFMDDTLAIPDLGTPFELPVNCRNTRQIADRCGEIRGVNIPVRDDAPEGVPDEFEVVTDSTQRMNRIRHYIDKWFGQGKLKLSQIAILSPFEQSKSCLANATKIGKVNLTTNFYHWRANNGVLFSTIRSFKGLEADAIIVTDVPNPESDAYFSTADFYVGCSRAKHLLAILATDSGVL
jgi:superfamily I DNA/RNA helicase